MDIKGFGEASIHGLIEQGYLKNIADIYHLKEHRDALIASGIIGKEKNTDKLLAAIEASKANDPAQLVTGFGIPGIGRAAARELMRAFSSIPDLMKAIEEDILSVRDMGEVSARAITQFFADEENQHEIADLAAQGVRMEADADTESDDALAGKTFVITGTLPTLGRKECASLIEAHGGRVTGSVSKKTDYLVAGEAAGSKLQKAQELGIDVIDEAALRAMIETK